MKQTVPFAILVATIFILLGGCAAKTAKTGDAEYIFTRLHYLTLLQVVESTFDKKHGMGGGTIMDGMLINGQCGGDHVCKHGRIGEQP